MRNTPMKYSMGTYTRRTKKRQDSLTDLKRKHLSMLSCMARGTQKLGRLSVVVLVRDKQLRRVFYPKHPPSLVYRVTLKRRQVKVGYRGWMVEKFGCEVNMLPLTLYSKVLVR